jgi:HEAT repeat protein
VLVERDKQVELWVRFVLMRFDTKEINDENLGAIAKAISHPDQGPRIQALAILGMTGEFGAKKIDDIIKALGDDDLLVVQSAISSLATLGYNAKPALPELRKLVTHKDVDTKKMAAEAVKFITDAKSPAEMAQPKKP